MSVKSIKMRAQLKTIVLATGLTLLINSCITVRPAATTTRYPDLNRADNLALGNPSGASTGDPNNYLISRPQYVLSYNNSRGIANWPGRRCG